jgi:hypothetical protein
METLCAKYRVLNVKGDGAYNKDSALKDLLNAYP